MDRTGNSFLGPTESLKKRTPPKHRVKWLSRRTLYIITRSLHCASEVHAADIPCSCMLLKLPCPMRCGEKLPSWQSILHLVLIQRPDIAATWVTSFSVCSGLQGHRFSLDHLLDRQRSHGDVTTQYIGMAFKRPIL